MLAPFSVKAMVMLFTFHSGYIPINPKDGAMLANQLYIPFWLYSNIKIRSRYLRIEILYIPFWLYSNDKCNYKKLRGYRLYIPFWLYSNKAKYKKHTKCLSLYIPFWLYSNKRTRQQ